MENRTLVATPAPLLPALHRLPIAPLLVLLAAVVLTGCGSLQLPGSDRTAAPAPAPSVPPPVAVAPPVVTPKPSPPREPADAVPRVSRIPQGAPNVPYEIKGESYEPLKADVPVTETGIASWYGKPFHGRRTATGEVYDMHTMTAAHKTMPLPSYAVVRNPANKRQVVVRVNDRGPFKNGRVIDLSYAAARKLGIRGIAPVEVRRLTHDEIRSGTWKLPPQQRVADARVP
jgi:rare lipoprotein A